MPVPGGWCRETAARRARFNAEVAVRELQKVRGSILNLSSVRVN